MATLIRSALGFGEALIAVPLLAFCIPLAVAAPLAVLVSITVAGIVGVQDWKSIHLGSTGWLVHSSLFGIPLGLLLLTSRHQRVVQATLAVIIMTFSAYSFNRPHTAGTTTPESIMASSLWILRRRAWRSLWNEWSAARCLRSHAKVVGAELPGDPSRIFSTRQALLVWAVIGWPDSGLLP